MRKGGTSNLNSQNRKLLEIAAKVTSTVKVATTKVITTAEI